MIILIRVEGPRLSICAARRQIYSFPLSSIIDRSTFSTPPRTTENSFLPSIFLRLVSLDSAESRRPIDACRQSGCSTRSTSLFACSSLCRLRSHNRTFEQIPGLGIPFFFCLAKSWFFFGGQGSRWNWNRLILQRI